MHPYILLFENMDKPTMIIFIVLSTLYFLPCSHEADPDPLQDFCVADLSSEIRVNGFPCETENPPESSDFFSSRLRTGGDTDNPNGSNATTMDAMTLPGLNTQGISMNRVDFAEGGINPPHVHPRGTELLRVSVGRLYIGMIDTENNFFSKILEAGDSFLFPRGMLHFQYNIGEGEATQFVSFNSQNPGILFVIEALFGSTPKIPTEVLARSLRVDGEIIEYIRSKFTDDYSSEITAP